jgi:hypothetical protein
MELRVVNGQSGDWRSQAETCRASANEQAGAMKAKAAALKSQRYLST